LVVTALRVPSGEQRPVDTCDIFHNVNGRDVLMKEEKVHPYGVMVTYYIPILLGVIVDGSSGPEYEDGVARSVVLERQLRESTARFGLLELA
jgi:hypothetical protein